ncbi:MAG: hypothetical protein U5K32_09030 [Bacteroidales bacterium]|nr:hypothetical protein [Bacteroidales bacterium]
MTSLAIFLPFFYSCEKNDPGGDNDVLRISATWYYPADGHGSDLGFRLVMSAAR